MNQILKFLKDEADVAIMLVLFIGLFGIGITAIICDTIVKVYGQ